MTSRQYDGILMLFISILFIILSFGLTFLFIFFYIYFIAVSSHCDNITTNPLVILGRKLTNNQPDKDYRLRLNRALTIVTHKANMEIHILGGITGNSTISESRAGQHYLENKKIKTKHINIEEMSCDTLDNMKQLKANTSIATRNITLITNRYHMARANILARGFGFIVHRCVAEDSLSLGIVFTTKLLAETFFLHWYLSGRIYAKLTRNKRMLARIQ